MSCDCLDSGGSSAIVELGDANKPHLSMTGFKSWVAWRSALTQDRILSALDRLRALGLLGPILPSTEAAAVRNEMHEASVAVGVVQVSLSDKIGEHAQPFLRHVQLDVDNAAGEGYVLLVARARQCCYAEASSA